MENKYGGNTPVKHVRDISRGINSIEVLAGPRDVVAGGH